MNYTTHHEKDETMEHEENEHPSMERKRKKPMDLILAHFNPKELEAMDAAQGGRTHIPGTKTPHYKRLEIMISAPGGEDMFRKAVENHASGGQIGESRRRIDEMKRKGRFGDTVMAYIGSNTNRVFDKAVKDLTGDQRENRNPHTGHPEYYGLSNFLGGLRKGFDRMGSGLSHGFQKMGSTLGGFTNDALSHLRSAAPDMIQGALQGGMEGGPEGALAGLGAGAAQGLTSSIMNPHNRDSISRLAQNPIVNQAIGAGASAYDRYNQGQNWRDNLASTLQQGTQGINNPYARALNAGAQHYYQSGGNTGQALAGGLGNYASQHPSQHMQAVGHGLQGYAEHGIAPLAALQAGQRMGQNMLGNAGLELRQINRPQPMQAIGGPAGQNPQY